MIHLHEWAARNGVSPKAMAELSQLLFQPDLAYPKAPEGSKENWVQNQIRMMAPQRGAILMRNNCGALKDEKGRIVRFGLYNDSAAMNSVMKSADLIGGYKLLIKPEHVGKTVLQFMSVECKRPGWVFNKNNEHELAQQRWANYILSSGGIACFSTGELPV